MLYWLRPDDTLSVFDPGPFRVTGHIDLRVKARFQVSDDGRYLLVDDCVYALER